MATCTCTPAISYSRPQSAAKLVALARAGHVQSADLHALGKTLLGRDLNAPHWRLPGLRKVPVRPGLVAGALRAALALSLTPRRVRLGTTWIKNALGQVDEACTPADLPPPALAQWLRAATFALLRAAVPGTVRPMQEVPLPDGWETSESPFASEYSNRVAMAPEQHLIAEETLGGMLALADESEQETIRMRIAGYSTAEIGQRSKVTARSVRRYLQLLGVRAVKAGVIDALPSRRRRRKGGAK